MKTIFLTFIFLLIINTGQAQSSFFKQNNNNRSLSTKYLPFPSALNFNTSLQNYAALPSAVYFSGDFTIECWVYLTATTNWSRIIDFGNGASSNNVLFSTSTGTSGNPGLHVGGSQYQANSTVPLNQWVHLAATMTGTSATIFINGIASGTATLVAPANVTRNYNYIGRSNWGWGDAAPDGSFDELRIWSIAKTGAQIQAAMNSELTGSEPNLVAYFKFNEGIPSGNNSSITTLINSALTGSMYNATLYNFTLNNNTSNFVLGKF